MPFGLIGGLIGGLGSAFSSNRAARAQERAARDAAARAAEAELRAFSSNTGAGTASFDPATGRLRTSLSDRLQGQQGALDNLASLFGGNIGQDFSQGAGGTIDDLGAVLGFQPTSNESLFSGLQSGIGGNLFGAQGDIFRARQGVAPGLGNQAFNLAGGFFNDLAGGGEAARSQQLDLLRQQAAPFEERAFGNLQQNLFSTGRLGTSGGALQTEAFARGLGQADLSRQLAANQEGRAFQQNSFNLGQGLFGVGSGERSLSDQLLGNAFSRFGNFAGLAADVEGQRFGQNLQGQQNLFGQLQSQFGNRLALGGFQQNAQRNQLASFLQTLGAGNALTNAPLDSLRLAGGFEQARGNSILGGSQVQGGLANQFGAGQDALASAFGGLAGFSQGGGFDFLSGLFGGGSPFSGATGGATGTTGTNPFGKPLPPIRGGG